MSHPSLKLILALFAGFLFSSLVEGQESPRSGVNFHSGTLYVWPAYVSTPHNVHSFCIGELLSNRPFTMPVRTTVRKVEVKQRGWSSSIDLPVRPAPGKC